jgi:DNA-directed RNA polymerase subunit RPC12/RpoP
MTALHDTDELTCPRCGVVLEGDFGTVNVEMSDDQIRTPIECPDCDAPLEVVVEMAPSDALGVEMWVEDRHQQDDDVETGIRYAKSLQTGTYYRVTKWVDHGDGNIRPREKHEVDREDVPQKWLEKFGDDD